MYNQVIQSFQELRLFIQGGGEMMTLPLLILAGIILGKTAKKIGVPSILGYLAGGILIGHGGLDLISQETSETLANINHVALGLMALTIGTHINFHRLKSTGSRVFLASFFDIVFPLGLVFILCSYALGLPNYLAFLLAAISVSTAPATVIALVQETRSKGALVNTLLPMIAINNVACILLFILAINFLDHSFTSSASTWDSIFTSLMAGVKELLRSSLLGLAVGYSLRKLAEKKMSHPGELLTGIFFFIMATAGISIGFNMNPMLPCLFAGIYLSNVGTQNREIVTTFEEIQHLILIVFFGLAGTHVQFSNFFTASTVIVTFVGARMVAKYLGATFAGLLSRSPARIVKYLGLTTLPQAGVAIGLLVLASEVPSLKTHMDLLVAVVIVAVSFSEVVGPILGKIGLVRAGEAGQDRDKLLDFIGEEYILPKLRATNKQDALQELTDFLVLSHNIPIEQKEALQKAILEREEKRSTAIGDAIAIPRGVIPIEKNVLGVIGLSQEGIDFGALDRKPVHLIILLVTPQEQSTEHLKILAEVVKLVDDPSIREQMFKARSAPELYEVIHKMEHKSFNYFLDR
jgi:Kef-type K+ transport system membrane component KefB